MLNWSGRILGNILLDESGMRYPAQIMTFIWDAQKRLKKPKITRFLNLHTDFSSRIQVH